MYSNYDEDAGHLFKLLGWKNLARQQQIQRVRWFISLCTGWETAYNLRDSENKRDVPLPRTNYYKNSFSYNGAVLSKSLPCDLRKAGSLTQFERLLKAGDVQGTAFVESSFFI